MTRREGEQVDSLLSRLARQVTARHDLDDVLTETLRCVRPLLPFGGGSIQLLDDDGWIRMASSDPIAPAHVMEQRVPLGSSVAGRVILTEQPVYIADLDAAQIGKGKRVSVGVRSYFAVPLVADGRAIGVLQIDSPEPDAWNDDDRALLLTVAPIVAAAIQSARAYARAAAARTRADAAEARLLAARNLLQAARESSRAGAQRDLDRHLDRLHRLLGAVMDDPAKSAELLTLPEQRASVSSG
ncbi:MAG TPA: GAF domain-containing protein [Mycobacteriales bacterium]|nr:GAF domain-containing protein [Mycobacteriales bacterium]